jgi:multidrug efflux pump subunit AcrB
VNLSGWALQKKPVVIAIVAILVAWGYQVFRTAPRREDPEFLIRDCVISTSWPGATAQQVEDLVTDKIETQLTEIPEIRRIQSSSEVGVSTVQISLIDEVTQIDPMWQKIKAEMKLVEPRLPPGCGKPVVNDKFGAAAAMVVVIYQDPAAAEKRAYTSRELEVFAKRLRDRLLDMRPLSGPAGTLTPSYIARLEMFGVRPEVIYLETTQGNWSKLKVTADDLEAVLKERNVIAPAGIIDSDLSRVNVRMTGDFDAAREVRKVVVRRVATGSESPSRMTPAEFFRALGAGLEPGGERPPSQAVPVYLDDVGLDVLRTYQDPLDSLLRYGDPETSAECILLSFTMKAGMNITDLGAAVDEVMAEAHTFLPPDIRIKKVSNQPETVANKIAEVVGNLVDSILIVLGVLVVLSSVRTSLVCALAIPMIMLIAVGAMRGWNVQIEQISLAALIISLGMLVDNAIQVCDNTQRNLNNGLDPEEAAAEGPRQIAFPILIATGTILAAFIPMLFTLSGGTKEYVYSLPVVVSLALGGGWIFAMTMTPIMASKLLKADASDAPIVKLMKLLGRKGKGDADGGGGYEKAVGAAIAGKWVTLVAAAAFMFWAFRLPVPSAFFPMAETKQFTIDVNLPDGAPIAKTDAKMRQLEAIVRALSSKGYDEKGRVVDLPTARLDNMAIYVGTGGPRFNLGLDPNSGGPYYGMIMVNATEREFVPDYVEDLRRAVREGIGDVPPVTGARVTPKRIVMGTPVPSPIDVRLHGPRQANEKVLRHYGEQIKALLRQTGICWDVHDSWGHPGNQLDVRVRTDQANMGGVTNLAIARTLNAYYTGHHLTTYREGEHEVPIFLRLPPRERGSLRELKSVYVEGYTGKLPLDAVADLDWKLQTVKITRYQRERAFRCYGRAETGYFESDVLGEPNFVKGIERIRSELPPGYRIEYGGIEEEAAKGANQNSISLGISGVLIFLLLIVQYVSFVKPIMILLTLPLAAAGGLVGLFIMDLPMGFMATLGFISLFGIVLSAAILMVDFSARVVREKIERGEGVPAEGEKAYSGLTRAEFRKSVAQAAQMRLMPILMTTLTTVGGVAPLMFGSSPLFKGLATVIAVGLSIGTLMTLFVLPAIMAIMVEVFGIKLAE